MKLFTIAAFAAITSLTASAAASAHAAAPEPELNMAVCRPDYPIRAAENGSEGMVEVGYLVGLDGVVQDSFIVTSSGIRELDSAAVASLRNCRIDPAEAGRQRVLRYRSQVYVWTLSPPGKAPPSFLQRMEKGSPMAHYLLALMYGNGFLVDEDLKVARRWLQSAADRGVPMAQYKIGLCYERGCGVPQDDQQAAAWYRKAAAQGNTFAREKLHFGFGSIAAVPEPVN